MSAEPTSAMMDVQLNSWLLFSHAAPHHGDVEIVSRFATGEVHRYTYRDMARRAQQLMHALDALEVPHGARVATLAWNHHRHLECYFGIPCAGRVLHTLNVRLSPAELAFIIRDAADDVILADPDQLSLLAQVGAEGGLETVRHVVVLGDHVPAGAPAGAQAYEALIAAQLDTYTPIEISEYAPYGMCYTSGTTGRSKGVVYTHRSVFLHAMAVSSAAAMSIGPADAALPVVPMFHAMAWGMPHAAVAAGAKLVFCAGPLDTAALADLLDAERVTVTAGVPTVWLGLADELDRRGAPPSALRRIVVGGAQPPRQLIERYLHSYGIPIL